MGKSHTEIDIRNKMLTYKVRVTSRISGVNKNKFFLDCLKKGVNENTLILNIVDIHYALIEQHPQLKELEFTELKKQLIELIKLK